MKKWSVLFFVLVMLSCSRNRDGVSENDVDPNFVPSTTEINLLKSNFLNLDCFYENNFVQLSADTSIVKNVAWYFLEENNAILMGEEKKQILEKSGNYRAKLTILKDENFVDSVLNFSLSYCNVSLMAPNAFKPNGDGLFDTWAPIGEGIDNITFTVSTRRGKKLFESTSLEQAWDGNYSGDKVSSGTYRYYMSGTYKNGYLFEKKGSFELIR